MDQRPALQWIELIDCFRNLARSETLDRPEEKLIRAASVALEGGWRIAADPKCMLRHDRPDHFRPARQSIRRRKGFAPALKAGPKRPGEPGIGGDQVAG